jgi:putative acetyltransferase
VRILSVMHLRASRPDDLPALAALFQAAIHGQGATEYDADQRAVWASLGGDLEAFGARMAKLQVVVAEQDGLLLGFLGYALDGHVDFLYVAPTAARQGVATALYRRVEEALQAAGVTALYTEASKVARPFFARQGFTVVEAQVVERGGQRLERFAMRKALD